MRLARLAVLFCLLPLAAFAQPGGTFGNFFPNNGGGQSISVTTTSASNTTWTGANADASELYVFNAGTGLAFCRWGTGAQTALTSDTPMPSGAVQVFFKGRGADTVACITGTGTATVYVVPGYGR